MEIVIGLTLVVIQPQESAVTTFPATIPYCVATTSWKKEDRDADVDFQMQLTVTLPGGESQDFPINFGFVGRRHRLMQRLEGIPLGSHGTLKFDIRLNSEYVATYIVDIDSDESVDGVGPRTSGE